MYEKLIIKRYRKDIVLQFKHPYLEKHKIQRYIVRRGVIKKFSFKSQRRLRLFIRNTSHLWKVFVHLTYPKKFSSDGKKVKKHLDTFLKRLKRYCPNIKFIWVIEFQERGAPHFHLLTDKEIDKNWLSQNWYGVVNSKDVKHLRVGTKVEAVQNENHAMAYIIGYLKKFKQKIVPEKYQNVGRFWSHSKNILKSSDYVITAGENNLKRGTKTIRRWYKAKTRSWGYKWKWRGAGFIVWDGVRFVEELEKRGLSGYLIEF